MLRTFRLIPTVAALATACSPSPVADTRNSASTVSSAGAAVADSGDTEQIRHLAEQVVQRGLRVRKGDVVMIAGGTHTIPTMEALAIETTKRGGLQSILLYSERVLRSELRDAPEENLSQPISYFADWLRSTTVYIGLPGQSDPKAMFSDIPESRMAKWSARGASIYEMLNQSNLRGAYIDYPSPGAAAAVGMTPEAFSRMQLAAIGADPDAMARSGKALDDAFRNAKVVRITAPGGTDLRVELAGRPGIVDAGKLGPGAEAEKLFAKRWFILPGGSFGVAPRDGAATGVLVAPKDQCKFRPLLDARYEFAGGTLKSVTAREGEACMKEQLAAYGAGIKRIGSLSIGLNPELKVVEDGGDYRPYNAAGLVGVVLGDNTLMGGSNKVDGAVAIGLPVTNATVEVDGKVVVRDGKLTVGEATAASSAP
jgi:aminopeptidase